MKTLTKIILFVTLLICYSPIIYSQIWQSSGLAGKQINSLSVCTNDAIFAGDNSTGLYTSTNNGGTWTFVTTGSSGKVPAITTNSSGGIYAAYTIANGHLRYESDCGSSSWVRSGNTSEPIYNLLYSENGYLFVGVGAGIQRSTDNGNSWEWKSPGGGIYALAIDANNNIYAGGAFDPILFRSTNNGDNWTQLSFPSTPSNIQGAIAIQGNYIFVGTGDDGIYRSSDEGSTWDAMNTGLGNDLRVTSIVVYNSDELYTSTHDGVYKSTNNGNTWTDFSDGLGASYVKRLMIDNSGYLYAGLWGNGIYRSNVPIPVELTSFTVSLVNSIVELQWQTATETNNQGFDVERNSGNGFEKIGFVAGFGTSTEIHNYSYVDGSLQGGTYSYRLKQIDYDGTFEYSNVVTIEINIPNDFYLSQNYPNPFNPVTTITYQLPIKSNVIISIYDVIGNKVKTLLNEEKEAGSYKVNFDLSEYGSGIYFYRLQAGDPSTGSGQGFVETKKMVLMK